MPCVVNLVSTGNSHGKPCNPNVKSANSAYFVYGSLQGRTQQTPHSAGWVRPVLPNAMTTFGYSIELLRFKSIFYRIQNQQDPYYQG